MGQVQYRSSGGGGAGASYGPTAGKTKSSCRCRCGNSCDCTSRGNECSCDKSKSGPKSISRTTCGAGVDGSCSPTAVTGHSSCKCGSGCDCTSRVNDCTCGSHAAQSDKSRKCGESCNCTSRGSECTCGRKESASAVCYEKDDPASRARCNSNAGDEMHHSQYFKKMESMSASSERPGSDSMHSKL